MPQRLNFRFNEPTQNGKALSGIAVLGGFLLLTFIVLKLTRPTTVIEYPYGYLVRKTQARNIWNQWYGAMQRELYNKVLAKSGNAP